jgi:hypothetical protein
MTTNIDVRTDKLLIGRSEELYQLVHNIQRGRHTLLVGPKGIGKTRLMGEAMDILCGSTRRIEFAPTILSRITGKLGFRLDPDQYKVVMISHAAPLGDFLKEIIQHLHSNGDLMLEPNSPSQGSWPIVKKQIAGVGSICLQEIVFRSVRSSDRPYLMFIDSFDRITPSHYAFVEQLLTMSVLCGAIVHLKEAYHFKKIWSSFNRIDLEPLPESESTQLIYHCIETYSIRVIDPELYRREILKSANGNPFHIKNMLWHGSRERNVNAEEIRKLRRTEEGDYFNMGPVYIFGVSVFTLFKLFSLGTDNREFYIYFSALGFLAYLAFRVFRAFFLFRPQRYDG